MVITGGASGIGRATAEAFVAAGAHVVLLDHDTPGSQPRRPQWATRRRCTAMCRVGRTVKQLPAPPRRRAAQCGRW
ncbi:MAG: SDR family NAD(P)-dependent oxidoreductase [Pseudonocardiaceae bacterium]